MAAKRFKSFPDAMHYAYYLAMLDIENDNKPGKYFLQKAGTMYSVDSWKSGPGTVEKTVGELDARHMHTLGYSSMDFAAKLPASALKAATKVKQNPAPKRKTSARTIKAATAYVKRPSQITKKAPSKRLATRRIKNLQVPRGVFPNPAPRMDTGRVKSYNVYIVGDGYESYIKGFKTIKAAKEYIASIDTDRIYRIRPVTLVSMLGPIFEGNRRDFKVKKNPAPRPEHTIYVSSSENKKEWERIAAFPDTPDGGKNAADYAKAYHAAYPGLYIKVAK